MVSDCFRSSFQIVLVSNRRSCKTKCMLAGAYPGISVSRGGLGK